MTEPGLARPWILRAGDRFAVTPLQVGLALVTITVGGFLLLETVFDRWELILDPGLQGQLWRQDFRVAIVLGLMMAFAPTLIGFGLGGFLTCVDELRPDLRLSEEQFLQRRAQFGRYPRLKYWLSGFAGMLLFLVIVPAGEGFVMSFNLVQLPLEAVIHRLEIPIFGFHVGGFVYAVRQDARRLSVLALDDLKIDLLDLSVRDSFVRQGLRLGLVPVGILSIASLLFADYDAAPRLLEILVAGLAVGVVVAFAGLVLPALGIRSKVRLEKRKELASCNEMIRRERDAFGASDGAGKRLSGMADLVAYKGLIESVHDWPFNLPLITRLALYTAIPLGSWIAGAMVERLINTMLD